MCEDRGIEIYGQLQALLNGENTYKRLHYLYGIADDKYNSREEMGTDLAIIHCRNARPGPVIVVAPLLCRGYQGA